MGAAVRVAPVADGRFLPKRVMTRSARVIFAKKLQSCSASAPPLPHFRGKVFPPTLWYAGYACAAHSGRAK